ATQTLERARAEAAQTLDRARAEANSVLASLTGQRDMLVTDLRATRRRLSELVGSIDATVEATPAFPLAGPGGKPFDPWADSPAATQAPHPPAPVQVPEPAEASSVQPPQPVHVPEPVEGPVAEAPDHVDPFAGLDPFAPPPSEAGLFDDFATGPSYEGAG